MTSGSAQSFGPPKLESQEKQQRAEGPRLSVSPSAYVPGKGALFRGAANNTCVGNTTVKALGRPGKLWARNDSCGPGPAYFHQF